MEDWAEIRRLHLAEGIPIKEIARRLRLARNTVREAIRSSTPPRYERRPMGSAVDAAEPDIRRLLGRHPRMPASVIAERIGWQRGMTVFRERVRDLRAVYLPPDPAGRTTYRPGELAQWDLWFPPVDIPIGAERVARPPVLVGVAGYSRWLVGRMIPSRETHDLLLGHLGCLVDLGRVPRAGVYDNEGAIGRWRHGVPQLTPAFQAFRGAFGMGVVLLKPADPESKGLVERANGYLETSFLPGRSFRSPADFNGQLSSWLVRANDRHHRIIGCRPADRIATDLAAMMALPPVLPDPAFRTSTRLGRDHYVRVTCAGELVGQHRRSLVPHQVLTDPAHEIARAYLRDERRELQAAGSEPDVEIRDLAVYDRLLGTVS